MTYLPSPADAMAAAQRLASKAVSQPRLKTSSRRSQAFAPARKMGWRSPALLGSAAALGAAALYTNKMTREAERKYPPVGRFLDVDGVRLHYIEKGSGEPLGNYSPPDRYENLNEISRMMERRIFSSDGGSEPV